MNRFAIKPWACVNGLLLLFFWGCVSQGEVSSIDSRLSELELRNAETRRSSEELQSGLKNRSEEDQAVRQQTASLRAKIDALGEEMRILSGRIEELEHSLSRQTQKDEDTKKSEGSQSDKAAESASGHEARILRIERYLNLEPSADSAAADKSAIEKPASKQKPAGEVQQQELSEDELYQMAKQAFDEGDSDAARKKFQELIERYPKSQSADNAQFWIGEIYYRDKWYEKAILEYQKVIENYPNGNKVHAALLKQGFAFLNLGDTANSRIIFDELVRKFPDSNEAKIAKQKLMELKK
jgi:tol-pal system protein YbgF